MPLHKNFFIDECSTGFKVRFFKDYINKKLEWHFRLGKSCNVYLKDLRFDLTPEIAEVLEKEYEKANYQVDINIYSRLITLR